MKDTIDTILIRYFMKIKRTLRSLKQLMTADDQNDMPFPLAEKWLTKTLKIN